MHPQLQQWQDGFRRQAAEARALVAPLSEERFNAPGPGGGWSVGQCLGHLLQTGEPLVEKLDEALEAARARKRTGAPPFDLGLVGRWFTQAVTPGARPVPTLRVFTPGPHYAREEVLRRFDALQERLAAFVRDSEGYDLARMRISSVVQPLLRLRAAAWLESTLQHQQRHLEQARRAAAATS
ncbi:MAG TPA: DinB family protein [Rhodothermales bacterium]|nr:DinB family protein [Rhodothermales bacterium]